MEEIILELISKYGYFSMMFLIAIENIFPPIPSEVILCFSGFITKSANLNLFLVILFSTMGSLIGAILLYYVGYLLSEKRILKSCDSRLGHILRLKKDNIASSIKEFETHGSKSIFFCRFIPIIRSLISIPAGISKYPIGRFLFLTTVGSFMWNTILILLGNMMGENWSIIATFLDKISWPIVLVIVILYFLYKKYKKEHTRIVISYDK